MSEIQSEKHICGRMVAFIEAKSLIVGKWEADHKVSNGYLRRAAKDGTNIGLDLIENFLESFPEVDLVWLITGKKGNTNNDANSKKLTPATNSEEAAIRKEMQKLRNQNAVLRKLTTAQAQAILHFSNSEMIEHG